VEVFSSRIEREYLVSYRCPPREDWDSWAEKKKSMWYGRGAKSCKQHSDAIRSACQQFNAAVRRIDNLEQTGNVTAEGLRKAVVYVNGNPVHRDTL
jgi:hypothetical protein